MVISVSPVSGRTRKLKGTMISAPSSGVSQGLEPLASDNTSERLGDPSSSAAKLSQVSPCRTTRCPSAGTSSRMPRTMGEPPRASRSLAATSSFSN
jgi:hypothetical protein